MGIFASNLARDLHKAVKDNDASRVSVLLGRGASPDDQLYWSEEWFGLYPPLHLACINGNLKVIQQLVKKGASVMKDDNAYDKMTPLHHACHHGQTETVKYLIEDLQCRVDTTDSCGYSPVLRAIRGHADFKENEKANADELRESRLELAFYLFNHGCNRSHTDKTDLLCLACRCGKLPVVKSLVEQHGLIPKDVNDGGQSPLHYACWGGNKKIVQYLIEKRCDVDVKDRRGMTPLDLAEAANHTEVVEYLQSWLNPVKTATPGDRVTLSHDVRLQRPFSCQWYFKHRLISEDHLDYDGSLTNVLVVKQCFSGHEGIYECRVRSDTRYRSSTTNYSIELKLDGTTLNPKEAMLLGQILKNVDRSKLASSGIDTKKLIEGKSDKKLEELQIHLSRIPEVQTFAENLNENLKSRVEEQDLYQEAMRDDITLSILYLKLLALGVAQVEKSTFLRQLLGLVKRDIDTANTQTACKTDQIEMKDAQSTDESSKPTDSKTVHAPVKEYSSQTVAISTARPWNTFEGQFEQTKFEAYFDMKRELATLTSLITSTEAQTPSKAPISETVKSRGKAEQTSKPSLPAEVQTELVEEAKRPTVASGTHKTPSNTKLLTLTSTKGSPNEISSPSHGYTPPPEADATDEDVSDYFREFEEIRVKAKTNPELQKKLVRVIINADDVGDQTPFLDALIPFINGPEMFVHFTKCNQKSLDTNTVMFKSKPDAESMYPKDYTCSFEEVFFTSLSNIECFGLADEEIESYICSEDESKDGTSTHDSISLLLATFADAVNSEERQAVVDEMEELLKEQIRDFEGLVECYSDDRVMFLVNNKSGGEKEVLEFQKALSSIMETRLKKFKVPARWFMLSMFLKLLARQSGRCTVSINECMEIGRNLGINDEKMVRAALGFLHKYIGLVMYFPMIDDDYLKNQVICSPQVIFTSISELIFKVYTPENVKSERIISADDYERFITTGQFSPAAMKMEDRADVLPFQSLLKLLAHHNIVARILVKTKADERVTYFLPAALPAAPNEELELPPRDPSEEELPEPLLLQFKTGYVPLGFFCALQADLVATNFDGATAEITNTEATNVDGTTAEITNTEATNTDGATAEVTNTEATNADGATADDANELELLYPRAEDQTYKIWKNKVTFRFRGNFDVTLISRLRYCEFRVCRAPGASVEDEFSMQCPVLRQALCKAVTRVIRKLSKSPLFQSVLIYCLGFKCPNTSVHPTTQTGLEPLALIDSNCYVPSSIDGIPKALTCSVCEDDTLKLSEAQKIWYGKPFPPQIILQPVSDLKVAVGKDVNLTVTAQRSKFLTYQWSIDGVDLKDNGNYHGSTTPTLRIIGANNNLRGKYFCTVNNKGGSVKSDGTHLRIVYRPHFFKQPIDKRVGVGSRNVTLTVEAIGRDLSYQWVKDGTTLQEDDCHTGVATSCLCIENVTLKDTSQYWCDVTDEGVAVSQSNHVHLTVLNVVDMTCDKLCTYLEQNEITGSDLQAFKGQKVNGKLFSTLPTDGDQLETVLRCTLTLGGRDILCELIKKVIASSSDPCHDQPQHHSSDLSQQVGTTVLDVNIHLLPIKAAIWEARYKWRDIGRALKLTDGTIQSIHESNDGERLHKVLSQWIQSGNAMIKDLLQALKHVTVNSEDIAKQILARTGEDRTAVGL